MLQKGNIFGVGPGCFLIARHKYHRWRMESHNIYGEIIGELGIPGTITWFFFIYYIFQNLMMVRKRLETLDMKNHFLYALATGLTASLIVRLVISMASHGAYYFYWYVIAALSVITRKIQQGISVVERNSNIPQPDNLTNRVE